MALQHQRRWAVSFREGFRRHGIDAIVTAHRSTPADRHVILGNWYALEQWREHPNVLMLDRCYFGDTDEVARVGWWQADGRLIYARGTGRQPPPYAPWGVSKRIDRAMILASFQEDFEPMLAEAKKYHAEIRIRRHPAQEKHTAGLVEALSWAQVVIGTQTTALVTAVLLGIPTVCLDERHIVYPVTAHEIGRAERHDRSEWIHDLADTQFSHREIAAGLAWEYLKHDDNTDCRACG